jgi:hypothetical protein
MKFDLAFDIFFFSPRNSSRVDPEEYAQLEQSISNALATTFVFGWESEPTARK